jgi:3'(2'), 5'-bisphosphate nucleotidase
VTVTDEELAAHLADGAGRLLIGLREGHSATDAGLGLIADKSANSFILAALAEWRPGDAILSEECPDNPARMANSRCWIIDPLDGTREYGEGRSDWAVHVALSVDGRPVVGAVALPALGRLYRSDGPPPLAPERERPVIAVSRTRPPEIALTLAAALNAELMEMGSAGAKAMAVVGGEADLYVHAGGQHQWDNCAPAAVALGLGLHASRIDGAALVYNHADTTVPDLLICRPDLAQRALAIIAGTR